MGKRTRKVAPTQGVLTADVHRASLCAERQAPGHSVRTSSNPDTHPTEVREVKQLAYGSRAQPGFKSRPVWFLKKEEEESSLPDVSCLMAMGVCRDQAHGKLVQNNPTIP